MDYCERNPFTGIPNVKVEQKVIQPLTEEEIQALLALRDPTDEFGCRNRAIILLFLDTGMRMAESHQLSFADVDWEVRRIHIRHGKGRKQRVVPFGDGPENALRDYIDDFRGEDEGPLFLTISRWGEPRHPMNKYLLGTLFTRLGARRRARQLQSGGSAASHRRITREGSTRAIALRKSHTPHACQRLPGRAESAQDRAVHPGRPRHARFVTESDPPNSQRDLPGCRRERQGGAKGVPSLPLTSERVRIGFRRLTLHHRPPATRVVSTAHTSDRWIPT